MYYSLNVYHHYTSTIAPQEIPFHKAIHAKIIHIQQADTIYIQTARNEEETGLRRWVDKLKKLDPMSG